MLEDELVVVITSDKQLLCEELTCTTHSQQPISLKNHNKQHNFDKWQVQNPCDNLLLMITKKSTINKLKSKKTKKQK